MKYILSIDQGTTGTRAILFDEELNGWFMEYVEHRQYYPRPGWVEHDAREIWERVLSVCRLVINRARAAGVRPANIVGLALSNQGESVAAWDRHTGEPLGNVVVWQCKRTSQRIEELRERVELAERVRARTGLPLDSYFSASKLEWILENSEGARTARANGDLLLGTLDTWLIWKLTGGGRYCTDHSTASRTMLYDIHARDWDDELLGIFGLERFLMAEILPTSGYFGETDPAVFFGLCVPILCSVVDQQAALFGHGCHTPGSVKCTYGSGCFMMMNTGDAPSIGENGIPASVGWQIGGHVTYVSDGGVYVAGTAFKWLRQLGLISDYAEIDALSTSVPDNGDLYFVTAFSGLCAPHWDQGARGTMIGLTAMSERAHIVRATAEALAFRVREVFEAMQLGRAEQVDCIRADGGVSASDFLMQFQADLLGIRVERSEMTETTAVGAAMLAGLAVGLWKDEREAASLLRPGRNFYPQMEAQARDRLLSRWSEAVVRSCTGRYRLTVPPGVLPYVNASSTLCAKPVTGTNVQPLSAPGERLSPPCPSGIADERRPIDSRKPLR